jgi:anthranilate phosphoribosyltransferase
VARGSLKGLGVDGVDASLKLLTSVLAGEGDSRSLRGARLVALNAGAALYVAGVEDSVEKGVARASEVLAGGAALEKLRQLASMTQGF